VRRRWGRRLAAGVLGVLTLAPPASAFDTAQTFSRGSYVVSFEGGYGAQSNIEGFAALSDLRFLTLGFRSSILPFGPTGPGLLRGALEVGLEPMYHGYTDPTRAYWAGLGGVLRYHMLPLGRLVPYAELGGGVGGGNLSAPEISSTFSFVAWGGLGGSVFLNGATALYAGYRFLHNSNGNTATPNRGWESHVGVAGVSYYFH